MSANRLTRPVRLTGSDTSPDPDELSRLRSLLLADDRIQLDARTAALEEALAQAVTKDAFADRLSDELAKALKRAERNDPKAIARAISPAVVQSIRREIVNSREDMVEALYPITGRMVRAAVRDAFSNLIADLNKRLDALTSPALLKAHAKSIVFRRPASSFLIADNANGLKLERGLLIDRQTGNLVHAWQPEGAIAQTDESTLASSMFAAISTFTAENYDGPDAELRTLDLNGRHVALRHSARHMLVVEHTGAMSSDAASHIDTCFEQIVESADDTAALAAVGLLAIAPSTVTTGKNKSGSAKLVLAALCLTVIGLLGWHIGDRVWFAAKTDLVVAEIAEQAPFHAPLVEAHRASRTVTVRGLVPPGFQLNDIAGSLAAAGVTLNNQTQPVAGINDLSAARRDTADQVADIGTELAALKTLLTQQNADITARLATVTEQMSALSADAVSLSAGLAGLDQQLSRQAATADQRQAALDQQAMALQAVTGQMTDTTGQTQAALAAQARILESNGLAISTLQQQVTQLSILQQREAISLIEATRLSFAEGDALQAPALADNQIAQIALLAKTHGLNLVVQGYSDEVGSAAVNERVSADRADRVVTQLIAAGLQPDAIQTQALGAVADRDGVIARQVRIAVAAQPNSQGISND